MASPNLFSKPVSLTWFSSMGPFCGTRTLSTTSFTASIVDPFSVHSQTLAFSSALILAIERIAAVAILFFDISPMISWAFCLFTPAFLSSLRLGITMIFCCLVLWNIFESIACAFSEDK